MISRIASATALRLSRGFRVVGILGPRQSGKTTLARATFPDKPYVSLELPDQRRAAQEDPRGFLAQYPDGAVLDEAQRAPDLLSYIQVLVDEDPRPGRFVLTGSQNLSLSAHVSQSLAGRIGILELLPFAATELAAAQRLPATLDDALFRGSYPPLYDQQVEVTDWLGAYVQTYVERDVRQLLNVQDLSLFDRFLRLCAANVGQMLSLARLGADCGLPHTTARRWLTVLEASYIVRLLTPHHGNFRKRLVKTPKLYFLDTGLAAHLLGIRRPSELAMHPLRGMLFENWMVAETTKSFLNAAERPPIHFWRDNTGHEVDLIIDRGLKLQPVECKSGATRASDWANGLRWWIDLAGERAGAPVVVYGGDQPCVVSGVRYLPWRDIGALGIASA